MIYEWTKADNDNQYWVEVETQHQQFGSWSDWFSIGVVSGPISPPTEGIGLGAPVSPLALLSVLIVMITAMTFTQQFAQIGMFAVAGVATLLVLFGWLPLDGKVVAFLWIAGFLVLLGRWRS